MIAITTGIATTANSTRAVRFDTATIDYAETRPKRRSRFW
jgi:hypothetical protein